MNRERTAKPRQRPRRAKASAEGDTARSARSGTGETAGLPLFLWPTEARSLGIAQRKRDNKELEDDSLQGRLSIGGRPAGRERAHSTSGSGMPRPLAAGLEALSGLDLSAVRVHRDSAEPAQLNALAYTRGRDIYLGPGQEKHLPHEGWHAVQQLQGRVQPTGQTKGVSINDAAELEREADVMGSRAVMQPPGSSRRPERHPGTAWPAAASAPVQAAPDPNRELVDNTIFFLEQSADYFAEPRVKIDRALFDKLLTSWYTMVVKQEEVITNHLAGNKALKGKLRAAYQRALGVLMKRAATEFTESEAELFRVNRGRIPMWAWKEASRSEAGFSTPIPQGQTVNAAGNVEMTIGRLKVTIKPDTVDNSIKKGAETKITYIPNSFGATGRTKRVGRKTVVYRITVTEPKEVTIQTRYAPSASAGQTSAYGRGTTAEDLAGAKVTPKSKTLGFHEGQHGMDFMQFLRNNPVPVFATAAEMSLSEFNTANTAFKDAWKDYQKDLEDFSEKQTDMVGTPKP